MRRVIVIFGVTLLSLTLFLACGKSEEPAKAPKPASKPQAAAPEQARQEVTKLQTYDDPNLPIRTDYPDIMEVVGTGSGEGSGFIFSFKPQGNALDTAKVHIFLPRGAGTAEAQEPFVTGPKGLLESNGWQREGETTDTGTFPFAWVRKIISFSDPKNQDMVGKVLLGEASGQAVQVILNYPNGRSDEFLANANQILGNLQFKADKLPLKRSL